MSAKRISELALSVSSQAKRIDAIKKSMQRDLDEWAKIRCPFRPGQEVTVPRGANSQIGKMCVVKKVTGTMRDGKMTWVVTAKSEPSKKHAKGVVVVWYMDTWIKHMQSDKS